MGPDQTAVPLQHPGPARRTSRTGALWSCGDGYRTWAQRRPTPAAATIGLTPLADTAELALFLDLPPERIRRRLSALRRGGWLASLRCGAHERPRTRWLLTRQSLERLYATDHTHPRPRERVEYERAWPLLGARAGVDQPPLDLGHEHLGPELTRPVSLGARLAEPVAEDGQHEHPPWSATGDFSTDSPGE